MADRLNSAIIYSETLTDSFVIKAGIIAGAEAER